MALILKDRVRETSSSSGTGNITLGGAISGYQTFNAAIASGSTVYYTIHNLTAGVDSEWEVGLGTFTSPATLARTTVLSSSNSGSAVNFTAGASGLEVFITQPAEEAVYINQATGKVEAFGNGANIISFVAVTSDLFTGNGSAISVINASNISSGTIDNSRTTAASANGASTIVLRDSGGSFDANLINAVSISGNAATVTGINASNIASGTIANARTTAATANGASTIVLRGASGEFAAGAITGDSFSGNGVALTAINASNISSGTLSATRGGTGSANLTADNVILGNGASAVKVVAPGTANNVLTSNGSTWISQAVSAGGTVIPAGTVMIFGQTAAPTGFTKLTNLDNYALRVVSGNASTGGSVAFTTAFASQTPSGSVSISSVSGSAGATTLSTPQIPSHAHNTIAWEGPGAPTKKIGFAQGTENTGNTTPSNNTGGGESHTHPFSFSSGSGTFSGNAINLAVQYVDVIRATKD
jgi:hypothetical protein